ncbi:hypothetical protein V6N11_022858 [Hibiscus sabdariffa]|uniref:Uncharacterized protein n=1 Tax=Hibiscus sabdariffa TaxID=183260 RepID=A0ABR2TKG1_9ROSI
MGFPGDLRHEVMFMVGINLPVLCYSETNEISQPPQSANKVSYSQVGFSYDGVKDEADFSDAAEEEEEDDVFNSDDSNDEGMGIIAKEFGVKR